MFIYGEHSAPRKQPDHVVCVLPFPKYSMEAGETLAPSYPTALSPAGPTGPCQQAL